MIAALAISASHIGVGAVGSAALADDALATNGIHDPVDYWLTEPLPAYTGSGTNTLTLNANGPLILPGNGPVAVGNRIVLRESGPNAVDNRIFRVQHAGLGGPSGAPAVLVADNDSDQPGELGTGHEVYVRGGTFAQRTIRVEAGAIGQPIGWEEVQEGLIPRFASFVGDAVRTAFDLEFTQALGAVVYVGGIIQPPSIYTISEAGGAGGVAQLVFNGDSVPALGLPIEVSYFTRS